MLGFGHKGMNKIALKGLMRQWIATLSCVYVISANMQLSTRCCGNTEEGEVGVGSQCIGNLK